ncbi:hypothetical protein K493DRAFT_226896 [Basidiobolus meristosporus CBS 931.73]|uniref:Protein kinase domain-containing protein n=1 Tax=Basidiobolus meristosporus CBS 931.73 TaxID=1314790 RepID=A0A1Y1Y1P3_9FUNG|nr:hypothetical protein K493DRAFT_226896 [Basidiobolus meristosporus CBS 931.73]|eukprot:ORX91930.1 hypothetical protein K493DRAFT_226896 [Basidiobolus meristosporus CBS 931.73]
MSRCQQTLRQYLHGRCSISAAQKYKLMRDLIVAVKELHDQGISHRNLSEGNVMINEVEGDILQDGQPRPKVVLIDFRKAQFTRKEDIQQWRVSLLDSEEENLLPKTSTLPDHESKRYRSVVTLPRSKYHTDLLPLIIDPLAEDVFSLGVLLWQIATQRNPWTGIFEDDIMGLRQIVGDERRLRIEICRTVPGNRCRELLFGCLGVRAEDRWNLQQLSGWIWNPDNRKQLIWEMTGQ